MKIQKLNMKPEKITEREAEFLYRNWAAYYIKQFIRRGFVPEDAEDIVQSAFMYFWENRSMYNNQYSVYTYFLRQIRRAVHMFLKQQRRTEQSIQAVKASGQEVMYEMKEEEDETDVVGMVMERLPEDLQDFMDSYLSYVSHDKVIEDMVQKGYTEDEVNPRSMWNRVAVYIKNQEPDLYTDVRSTFYGKTSELSKAAEVRLFVRDMEPGDEITVFRTLRDRECKKAMMQEVISEREKGGTFDIEQTDEYTKVTKL